MIVWREDEVCGNGRDSGQLPGHTINRLPGDDLQRKLYRLLVGKNGAIIIDALQVLGLICLLGLDGIQQGVLLYVGRCCLQLSHLDKHSPAQAIQVVVVRPVPITPGCIVI